jgi:hypothetical protein
VKRTMTNKQDQNRQRVRDWDRGEVLLGQLTGDRGPAPGGVKTRRKDDNERRNRTIWSFIYGGFNPRRRHHRRGTDDHKLYIDWHESTLLWLALALMLMSCTDALFTLNLMAVGADELNWFMRGLIEQDISRFLNVKIALTGFGVVTLVAASRYRLMGRRIVKGLFQVMCCMYALLISYEIMLLSPFIGDVLGLTGGIDLNLGTLFSAFT